MYVGGGISGPSENGAILGDISGSSSVPPVCLYLTISNQKYIEIEKQLHLSKRFKKELEAPVVLFEVTLEGLQ